MVSSINCHTAISKYVDQHLRPIVKQIPSYVKDTNDFINKINAVESVPKNSYVESIRQLLKENYKHQSYNNVLSINTYIE